MRDCSYCGKPIKKPPRYYWKGLSPQYCSIVCAAWGCDNAILIEDEVIE